MIGEDRLLSFEIGELLFAIPIAAVLEVAPLGATSCIPTVPPSVACVVNYRGDALPVVRRVHLFDLGADVQGRPEHVLVVTDRGGTAARLGLDVDRVLGLMDGCAARAQSGDPVAERRPSGGRMAHILDPARLIERARDVIESSPNGG